MSLEKNVSYETVLYFASMRFLVLTLVTALVLTSCHSAACLNHLALVK